MLGFVVFLLFVTYNRLNYYITQQESLNYPFYSERQIWTSKIIWETNKKIHEEADKKLEEYRNKHEKELDKVKRNQDHSEEFKDIICSYHNSSDEVDEERQLLNFMLESNYAIRNGRKTFNQVGNEIVPLLSKQKSRHDQWLEH